MREIKRKEGGREGQTDDRKTDHRSKKKTRNQCESEKTGWRKRFDKKTFNREKTQIKEDIQSYSKNTIKCETVILFVRFRVE